jgi:type II secretory pathway component GspD/PulD (secretin)
MRNAILTSVLVALLIVPAIAEEGAKDPTSIKYDAETSLQDFIAEMGVATNKTLIFDPNGQRIRNQQLGSKLDIQVPTGRLFDTYRAVLSFFELALVPVGPSGANIYLVTDSRSTNNFVKNKATFVAPEDVPALADRDGMYIATIFPIQHVRNMTTLRTAMSTMVSPAGIGRVYEIQEVGVVVMDFAPTVAGIQNLLRKIDIPSASSMEMASIELTHAKSAEVADTIQSMFPALPVAASRRGFAASSAPRPIITSYAHRNAIVVRASRQHMEEIRKLVTDLDSTASGKKMLEVVKLQTLQAREVATTIMAAVYGGAKSEQTVNVIGDRSSNAIIVSGTVTEVRLVLALIARLDTPKPAAAK